MQEVKEDTAATILIGPFVDEADGVTPITNASLSSADAAEIMKHDGTAFVDISGLTFTHKQDGWYTLALTASELDTPGRATIVISDADLFLPVWKDLMVLPANIWDSKYGSDKLEVDVVQCGGSAVAAGAIPNAGAGANGGLPTVDGNNRIVGIQGTKNQLDDLNDLTEAQVNAQCDTALSDYDAVVPADLPTNFGDLSITATTGLVDITQAAADKVWATAARALTDKAGFSISGTKQTLDALNDLSAADVGDAVWDEVIETSHETDATAGEHLNALAKAILARVNNQNLNALLGVDDAAGEDVPGQTAEEVWAESTRALTDKADFALSSASRDAIWDQASAVTLSFETLITRMYQLLNNRLEVTDSSGAASLKALGNGSQIASSNISDNDTLTDRDEWSWT